MNELTIERVLEIAGFQIISQTTHPGNRGTQLTLDAESYVMVYACGGYSVHGPTFRKEEIEGRLRMARHLLSTSPTTFGPFTSVFAP